MKKFAKKIVVSVLGWQVRRLGRKNHFKIVGVAGSIGKTSTKFAIARVLSTGKKVRFQEGNYNDLVSVPLIFFGHGLPGLLNVASWLKIFINNEKQLRRPYPFDVVVVEVGTDGPGQISEFGRYLKLDYAVVTAVTPEHMEFFADLDAVAQEELAVAAYADKLIANADLCDLKYLKSLPVITYGTAEASDYRLVDVAFKNSEGAFTLKNQQSQFELDAKMQAVSLAEIYSAASAAVIGEQLGLTQEQIKEGIKSLQPVAGRMQRLKGLKDSLIIDETYNASPVAVKAALDSLYAMSAPQKIAILGNMNELGGLSEEAHREIGNYCEPKQLDLVVTIGPDANMFTAKEAKTKGCTVATFDSPYAAGEFVKNRLKKGAVVLAKGSQNGVFAEEAVKVLLQNREDEKLLVRQTPEWMKQKAKNLNG